MKCPNCGAKATGDICEYCGTKLNENHNAYKPFATYNYNYTYTQDYRKPFAAKTGEYTNSDNGFAIPPPKAPHYQQDYQQAQNYRRDYQQSYQQGYQPYYQQSYQQTYRNEKPRPAKSEKSLIVCFLLCVFLGYLGIHRFYAGRVATGILYMFTGGLFGIGYIIDIILIVLGQFKDRRGRKISWMNLDN